MPNTAKHLIIGSTAPYSGKSTLAIAIGSQLQTMGVPMSWGKPLASVDAFGYGLDVTDGDLTFVPTTLGLEAAHQSANLLSLNRQSWMAQIQQPNTAGLGETLSHYWDDVKGDLALLEGPSNLEEGALFNLSLPEMAIALDAQVILVMHSNTLGMIDQLVAAQKRLGPNLLGVVLNEVSEQDSESTHKTIAPYLEQLGIPVLGMLPELPFLQGIRVSELVRYLNAEVLCGEDHLDLVVESLKIGAMNVNSALRFFGQGTHQAVVTGGDRRDLQIAALETSTHCLILTGQIAPSKDVLLFAKDKEVPVLSVATDTLSTVERIEMLFGRLPLNNPDKVPLIKEHLASQVDMQRLLTLIGLETPAIAPRG
ncbi:phosphotransacetylase family protein [Leptolyngbya iicbica]|uniref:Phosphotransacetylase family protein n=2 Tax=Cyanophyceae TaxID=3028117 RepID=A0A4Q7ELY1_9CYAN|nr:phosphotransacetylase family protein [Leptolyngbya sp. LK]RZM82809.1 phosphotransacetylase family protein [Leptolyngbya sp. LK]